MAADFDVGVAAIIFLLCFCCDSSTLLGSLSQGKCGVPGAGVGKFAAHLLARHARHCQGLLTPRRTWSIDTPGSYAAQVGGGSSALALAPVALHEVHEGVPMHCPRCGFANPEGMNFCGHCGTGLSSGCPHCGFESPPGFAF